VYEVKLMEVKEDLEKVFGIAAGEKIRII